MTLLHLDTNALIALADPTTRLFAAIANRVDQDALPGTSVIAWHEYARGPLLPADYDRASRFLDDRIAPVTRAIAELAADLFNATGRRRASTADCLIAATAISNTADFLTNNLEDFECFRPHGLRLLAL